MDSTGTVRRFVMTDPVSSVELYVMLKVRAVPLGCAATLDRNRNEFTAAWPCAATTADRGPAERVHTRVGGGAVGGETGDGPIRDARTAANGQPNGLDRVAAGHDKPHTAPATTQTNNDYNKRAGVWEALRAVAHEQGPCATQRV